MLHIHCIQPLVANIDGKFNQGSIGNLLMEAIKVARVLEKEHLEALSKLLFAVDFEPCVGDVKSELAAAHPIHQDLVIKIAEIKSFFARVNRKEGKPGDNH